MGVARIGRALARRGARAAPRTWRGSRVARRPIPPAPRVLVVIPARLGTSAPRAIRSLEFLDYPPTRLDVILACGLAPARQRNEAARCARADYILFLDDDSSVAPDLLHRMIAQLRLHPDVGAIGGPAVIDCEGTGAAGRISARLFSDPWVVGRSAARYSARGGLRATDERELILCNLLVRREAFDEVGGFDERLYPNEENLLLERLRARGWKLLYDPHARVERPGWPTAGSFLRSVFGYGRGRGEQARLGLSAVTAARVLQSVVLLLATGLALLGALSAGLSRPALFLAPMGLYALYAAILAVRMSRDLGAIQGLAGGALTAAVHMSYAAGVIRGILRKPKLRRETEVAVSWPALHPVGREPLDVQFGDAALQRSVS